MPSTGRARPQAALAVAERYLRVERPLNYLLVTGFVALSVGTYYLDSLLTAVVVAGASVAVLRVPVLRSSGRLRMQTDEAVESVVDAFSGPTPPLLALQWGPAETVTLAEGTATYHVSYLFGLRSVEVTVDTHVETTPAGDMRVESVLEANGQPWSTYTSTIGRADGRTLVEAEYTADRRFGIRRLPQLVLARRYRHDALTAQGYTVLESERHVGL